MENPLALIKPNREKALMLTQREVSVFVMDAVAIEGIYFTLPEIQTLLQDISVGGYKLSDQQIAVNQGEAWRYLFSAIKNNQFSVSKIFTAELYAIASKHTFAAQQQGFKTGQFRNLGVSIAGSHCEPPPAEQLDELFIQMLNEFHRYSDIYDQAIYVFLTMARYKFFSSLNRCIGKLMMNGILLEAGFPAISVSATRKSEFTQLMLAFYESGDPTDMNRFMRSCLDHRWIQIMQE
ncbi:MAG: cell filamentation protein Fic [Pseudomonadota bacterium]